MQGKVSFHCFKVTQIQRGVIILLLKGPPNHFCSCHYTSTSSEAVGRSRELVQLNEFLATSLGLP